MARKDLFKGTLEAMLSPEQAVARPPQGKGILHNSALGAVEAGLAHNQNRTQVVDLDPSEIKDSEHADRLPYDDSDLTGLVESIRAHGQQIPILVYRKNSGGYRVIYGRRRLAALRTIGGKVRALISHTMGDDDRIIAQGIENAVRKDLSFIEKALFAHRLRESGVKDVTIKAALNIDVNVEKATQISTMKMVVNEIGEEIILAIGAAPDVGRTRWRAAAKLFQERFTAADRPRVAAQVLAFREKQDAIQFTVVNHSDQDFDQSNRSDARFEHFLASLRASNDVQKPELAGGDAQEISVGDQIIGITKASRATVTLTVRAKDDPSFHRWVSENADRLLRQAHDEWAASPEYETLTE